MGGRCGVWDICLGMVVRDDGIAFWRWNGKGKDNGCFLCRRNMYDNA